MHAYNHLLMLWVHFSPMAKRGSSWSYGSWIYNYICNQCLSPLTLWNRILLRRGVLDTTLCDKLCQWLAAGLWFSPGTLVSSTNKTDRLDITEILLKVVLNTATLTLNQCLSHAEVMSSFLTNGKAYLIQLYVKKDCQCAPCMEHCSFLNE